MADQTIEQARQYAEAGDLERAATLCTDRLAARPDDPDALHLLGVLRCAGGDADAAVSLIQRAIAIDGGSAKHFSNLGNAFKAQGNPTEAATALQRATALDPGFEDAHFNLGVLLEEQGRLAEAASEYQQTIDINPAHADACHNLGVVLRREGRIEAALAACQRAVSLNPASAGSRFNLGLCQQATGRLDEAAASFAHSIRLGGRFAPVYLALGDARASLGQYAQALEAFEEAARLEPARLESIADLAFRLESENRLEDAQAAVQSGLVFDPAHPLLRLIAAKLARRNGDLQQGLQRLQGVDLSGVKPELAAAIRHELGLLYDRLGDSQAAFAAFADANRLQLQAPQHQGENPGTYLEFVAAWRRDFTDAWLASCTPHPKEPASAMPVFIIGFPRSGTTLLEQILDSHPRLKAIEEKPLVNDLMHQVVGLQAGTERLPQTLARLDAAQAASLRQAYFEAAARYVQLSPGEILVDKLPLNIVRVPLIWRIFPDAKFILALRHPCDVCLSCFMHLFGMNPAMANFTALDDTALLYTRVMGLWQHYAQLLPLSCHRVRYEDMVADPREETQRLFDFLGIEWDDAVLRFYEHARRRSRIDTPSYHQVTEPIYDRAANRWKRYQAQLEPVMDPLRPFAEAFGYGL